MQILKIFKISLFFIVMTSCSSFGNFLYKKEYSFKISDKIKILKNSDKNKIYISKIPFEFGYNINLQNELESQIAKIENLKVVKNINEADYILNINISNSSSANLNSIKLLRNYIALESSFESFYIDANNNPRQNNQKNILDLKNHNILEDKKGVDSLTKIGAGSIFGASVGYLTGQSLISTGIGAVAALPAIILAEEVSKGIGYIMVFEIELEEITKQKINTNKRILKRNASNSTSEINYSEIISIIPYNSKVVILGTGSIYNLEELKSDIINLFINCINQVF